MSESIREAFLSKGSEPVFSHVRVPELDRSVRVYSMTQGEIAAFHRETLRRKKKTPDQVCFQERLIIATVRDDDGKPIFTAADEASLSAIPVAAAERLVKVAMKVNRFVDDEEQDDDEGN